MTKIILIDFESNWLFFDSQVHQINLKFVLLFSKIIQTYLTDENIITFNKNLVGFGTDFD